MAVRERLEEEALKEYLEELCGWDALEVISQEERIYMPYVMNDAVECYLLLEGVTRHGDWDPSYEGETDFQMTEGTKKKGIILYQGAKIISIWYENAYFVLSCYQYHEIGHMWRKKNGEEHWRRLVNILCVLHDKASFLGERAVNEREQSLLPLAEFAPIRFFTPINESIDGWYPDSQRGIDAMRLLLQKAKDEELCEQLDHLEQLFHREKLNDRQIRLFAEKLQQAEHAGVYQMLEKQIEEASLVWEKRSYETEEQQKADKMRLQVENSFRQEGFCGNYPRMAREEGKKPFREMIHFVEEQPFTILEAEEYHFRIFAMYSKGKGEGSDFGFFKGRQREGRMTEVGGKQNEDGTCFGG